MDDIKNTILDAISQEKKSSGEKKTYYNKNDKNKVITKKYKSKGAKYIPFKEMKFSKWEKKSNLFDWNNRDFAIHISDSYRKRYQEFLKINIVGLISHMSRLKQAISEINGFCDNVVLKDYIDHYFIHFSDINIKKYGGWTFNQMLYNQYIINFINNYDYKKKVNIYSKQNDTKSKSLELSVLKEDYEKGLLHFVRKYGYILCINYIVTCEDDDLKEVLKKMSLLLLKVFEKDPKIYEEIIEITTKYSPYPDWFSFRKYQTINKALQKRHKDIPVLNGIKFNSSNWDFIRS